MNVLATGLAGDPLCSSLTWCGHSSHEYSSVSLSQPCLLGPEARMLHDVYSSDLCGVQAQQKASEAVDQQKKAQALVISKGVELASLSGQLEAANRKGKAGADKVHAQYRPKIQNLEAQVQQLREALENEAQRNRKRTLPKFEL